MNVTIAGQDFVVADHPFWADAASGKWEPYTFEVLAKYVPGHLAYLDVGAWIGPTALFASRFCKNCTAVEPDPVAFAELKDNVLESGSPVRLFNGAVMDYAGKVILGSEKLGNSMTRLSAAHPGSAVVEVPCVTLKSLVGAPSYKRTFIKMDVEGAEELILRDKAFFEMHKPTLYLSTHEQWFRNPTTAWETINGIGSLYANRIEIANNTLLFTDL